jgi:homoserine O-acetyltransferase
VLRLRSLAAVVAGVAVVLATGSPPALAAEGDATFRDFRFGSGETLPELRLHYLTLGTLAKDARGHATNAVLVLHGTGGTGRQFLVPQFANELYGAGQPLDTTRVFVVLADGIGHGRSSKPSDGLHMKFPHYDYEDMVRAQHRLLTEALGVDHLRLVMGTSMGAMHTFVWAEMYPTFADAAMPLACLPVAIVGRNRLWRRMVVDAIENDPVWKAGEYGSEPLDGLRTASDLLTIAGSAPLFQQATMATRDSVDRYLARTTAARLKDTDANDLIYQLDASRNYDPSPKLESIVVPLVHVNSADDFINPPELGIAEREIRRVRRGRFVLIPASESTHGHGTHTWAVFWKDELVRLLAESATPSAAR